MQYGSKEEQGSMKLQVAERVRQYTARIAEYTRSTYNETEVRIDFVNPFFKSLGWDVDNEAGLPQHLREVTHEATVLVEENGRRRSKKPDYSFRVGTETLFYLETKKPSVDITKDNAPAFQLRRYGWSGNLKISVLTNFTDLFVYDCSIRPIESDGVSVALIAHYSYTEYEEKFDEIYGLLSKEAVITGAFYKHFENINRGFRREPFDSYFLKQINQWRLILGEDIRHNNQNINERALNIGVQRILNRIIFLRICEDRSFEEYETLKNVKNYEALKELFVEADRKYDSGLFAMLDEDNFIISDSVLIDIFLNLYYPNNSYEFSVVDPFIVGQIYELYLEETLHVSDDGTVKAIKKPEIVDSQGVVNTPKNVTDIIVEQTLSTIYKGKNLVEVRDFRVMDICCGAGNFLLSAYEYIVNFYIEWLLQNERDKALQDGRLIAMPDCDAYRLSFAMRREILLRNIWGVDIDSLAVEVTKFSLCLKLLEDTGMEEIDAFAEESSKCILPQLDDNVKTGNSLIDMSYARYDPDIYEREGALEEIQMFDWKSEFKAKGFDVIIGNPPYIRVQNMVRYSFQEYGFYKSDLSNYQTACSELLDKYYLFIERAWNLLKINGVMGYIIPHKFMNIASGEHLREFLASRRTVRKIVHFGTHQAFKGRSTYTCILILKKSEQESFEISFVQNWSKFLFDHQLAYDRYPIAMLGRTPWTFIPRQISDRIDALSDTCSKLSDMVRIFVGVQTSNDKIYILKADCEDETYIYFHDKSGLERKAEKGILRKCIYDTQLKKYYPIASNRYIIFPYQNENGKMRLIDIDAMKLRYPYTFSYLMSFKDELDERSMNQPRTERNWYAYGRSQSLARFGSGEHLIWPVLSRSSNYVYDNDLVVFTGGGNGPFYGIEVNKSTKESIFYIQAVLNHWLMELLVKRKASAFQGEYYSHGKQFIAELPIYRIDFDDKEQKSIHDAIVKKVHQLENLNVRMGTVGNSSGKKAIQRAANSIRDELSIMIDRLYNVEGLQGMETDEDD